MNQYKKILVLTPRLPYPLESGDRLRIYNICKYLKDNNLELYLISFVSNKKELSFINHHDLKNIFKNIDIVYLPKVLSYINSFIGLFSALPLQIWYYKSKKFESKINERINQENFDFILVHLIRLAPYVFKINNIKKVLEMTDSLSYFYNSINQNNFFNLFKFIYQKIEKKRVFVFEKECIKKFDYIIVVSKRDKEYLLSNLNDLNINFINNKIKIITNGVNPQIINAFNEKSLNYYDKNLAVFIGNMRSYQNKDAIFYFIKEILPLIRKEKPNFKFRVVGADISKEMIKLCEKNNVEFTGRVDNIINYIKKACLSVAPIRVGAGIQNKILESMALGIPVITTSLGFEGINNCIINKHLIVADNKYDFAKKILELIDDPVLRNKIALEGRKFILDFYKWENFLKDYISIFI